jgi:hypothetical protein
MTVTWTVNDTVSSTTGFYNLGEASYVFYDAGSWGYVEAAEDTIDSTGDWTWSLSFYQTTASSTSYLLSHPSDTNMCAYINNSYLLYLKFKEATATVSVRPNQWHHLAVVHDSANSTITFFLDGIKHSSKSYTTALPQIWQSCYVGAKPGNSVNAVRGYVCDFHLASTQLYTGVAFDPSQLGASTPGASTVAMNLSHDLGASALSDLDRTVTTTAGSDYTAALSLGWMQDDDTNYSTEYSVFGSGCLQPHIGTTDGQFSCPYMSSDIDATGDWTLDFNFYPPASTSYYILCGTNQNYFALRYDTVRRLIINYNNGSSNMTSYTSNYCVIEAMWAHVGIIHDSTNSLLNIYVNGIWDKSLTVDSSKLADVFTYLKVGGQQGGYDQAKYCKGYICDFRLTAAMLATDCGWDPSTRSSTTPEASTKAMNFFEADTSVSYRSINDYDKVLTETASGSDTVSSYSVGAWQRPDADWSASYARNGSAGFNTKTANTTAGYTLTRFGARTFDATGDWTLSFNLYIETSNQTNKYLFYNVSNTRFFINLSGTRTITFVYPASGTGSATYFNLPANCMYVAPSWYNITVCHNSTTSEMSFFLCGIRYGSKTVESSYLDGLFDNFIVGGYNAHNYSYGYIADLSLTGAALYDGYGINTALVSTTTPNLDQVIMNLSETPSDLTSGYGLYATEKTITETADTSNATQSNSVGWCCLAQDLVTQSGKLGTASFEPRNGTTYNRITMSADIDGTGDWTMQMNVKFFNTGPNRIIYPIASRFKIYQETGGLIVSYPNASGSISNAQAFQYVLPANSDWKSLVAQHDSTNSKLQIYLDGVMIHNLDVTSIYFDGLFTALPIGYQEDNYAYAMVGNIADFSVTAAMLYPGRGYHMGDWNISTPGLNTVSMNLSEDPGSTHTNALMLTDKVLTVSADASDHTQEYDVGWGAMYPATLNNTAFKNGDASLQNFVSTSSYGPALMSCDIDGATSDWTIECWANIATTSNSRTGYLFTATFLWPPLCVRWDNYTTPILVVNNTVYSSGLTFTRDTWHHIALCYDSTTQNATLYCNGVSSASASLSVYNQTSLGTYLFTPLSIGARNSTVVGDCHQGYINTFHVTDSVLYTADFDPETDATTAPVGTTIALNFMTFGDLIKQDQTIVLITSENGVVVTVTTALFYLAVETSPSTSVIYYTLDGGSEIEGGTGSMELTGLDPGATYTIRLDDEVSNVTSGTLPALSTTTVSEVTATVKTLSGKVEMGGLSKSTRTLLLEDISSSFGSGSTITLSDRPGKSITTVSTGDSVSLSSSSAETNLALNLDTTTATTITVTDGVSVELTADESGNLVVDGVTLASGSSTTVGGYLLSYSSI